MRQSFETLGGPLVGRDHLPLLRAALSRGGLDGFIIPHDDEHKNEFLPSSNERLAWVTGFTGSTGVALVLADKAVIFVDPRYTLQVADQTDSCLFERLSLDHGGVAAFLVNGLSAGMQLGYDPRLHTPNDLEELAAAAVKGGIGLRPVSENPVDVAWGLSRPLPSAAPIVPHSIEYAGETSVAKRRRVGTLIGNAGAECAVLTAPSSIAWLFNIRGGDVPWTPLPIGQAIVRADGTAKLFLEPCKVTWGLAAWLGDEVALEPQAELSPSLATLKGRRVLLDPSQSSVWYFDVLTELGASVIPGEDPCLLPRACKNPVEIQGARNAHRRDAAAVVRGLHWLATEAQTSLPDEIGVARRMEAYRDATGELKDLSFDTIASSGSNAPLVHLRPNWKTNRRVKPGELLLVDSGGQYLDGTTDVTRTVAIGEPSAEMIDRFTRVLKGHISLARIRFPPGTTGHALDVLARQALWMGGADYDTRTGHGVGSFLGVHEGPQEIGRTPVNVALRPGMILSNEPGFYKTGAYAIRIENLQVVTEATAIAGGERPMLGFETLTLAPIDRRLIRPDLLETHERDWLNLYHARVRALVAPLVEVEVADWLSAACAPL